MCFQILPRKWLSKPFLAVVFANSNLLEQKFCAFFSEEDLLEVLNQSVNVFKSNMFDRYIDFPDKHYASSEYSNLETFFYAQC